MNDYKFDPFEEDGEEAFDNLDMDNELGSLKDAIQDLVNAFETKYDEFTANARHIISELNTALIDKCNEIEDLENKISVGDSPTGEMILPFLNKLAVLDYNVLKSITEQYVDEQGNPKVRDEAIVKALKGKEEVKKEPKPKKKSAEEIKQELAEVDKTIAEMKANPVIDEDANIKGLVGDDFQPTVNVPLQEPEKPKPSINDLF